MNKITILLLLIGSAVLVIAFNRYEPVEKSIDTPWTVEHSKNNEIQVLGITLGKSQLNDVNKHFSKQGKSYIVKNADQTLSLISVFEGVTIDRLIANVEITYTLPQTDLLSVLKETPQNLEKIQLTNKQLTRLSNASADRLTYYPSINYNEDIVLQHFGYPDNKKIINQDQQRWTYRDMHLEFYLNENSADKLVYTAKIPST